MKCIFKYKLHVIFKNAIFLNITFKNTAFLNVSFLNKRFWRKWCYKYELIELLWAYNEISHHLF